jgi:uncharacterized protein YjbJ (UPF0337 family)
MNQDRFVGNLKQFRGKVKERWGKLTNNQFVVTAGIRDRLTGRTQERNGLSTEEGARQLKDFINRNWRG